MTIREWDADQAVERGPLDEALDGCSSIDRYGVAGCDELSGEPLIVALAQEEPDDALPADADDPWVLVNMGDEVDSWRGGCEASAEELAIHVVTP